VIAQSHEKSLKRAAAMNGINRLLHKLEVLFTFVMFGIIVFIYSKPLKPIHSPPF
jgi:hypothetical protein